MLQAALLWVGLESIRRDMQAIEDALEDSPQVTCPSCSCQKQCWWQESSGPTGGTKHGKHRAAPHHGTQPAVEPQPNAVPQVRVNLSADGYVDNLECREQLQRQRQMQQSGEGVGFRNCAEQWVATGN